MGQLKINSFEKIHQWTFEIIQKFGRKMKNFEKFFDVYMDTSVIVNNIKKNFKIFHFLAKFFPWNAHAQPAKIFFFRQKVYFCPYFHFRCPYLLSKCASGILKFTVKMTYTVNFSIPDVHFDNKYGHLK